MRVVVDTNVLVRALIMPHGTVGPVLLRLRHGDYTLLYAQSLLRTSRRSRPAPHSPQIRLD